MATHASSCSSLLLSVFLGACAGSDTPTSPPPKVPQPEVGPLATVAEVAKQVGPDAPLGDTPATLAYERLDGLFGAGQQGTVALGVYRAPAPEGSDAALLRRASALGLGAEAPSATPVFGRPEIGPPVRDDRGDLLGLIAGPWSLTVNRVSGSERVYDRERFHASPPGPLPGTDAEIVRAGAVHGRRVVEPGEWSRLYPYKVRRYMNGVTEEDAPPRVETYQVAVAFNVAIDGVPVIGSGGKLAVHLAAGGDVVGHELTLRSPRDRIGVVPGAELRPPREARGEAEKRLAARGARVQDFELARSEFGYYELGRNSTQSVVAPAYGYVFVPRDGVESKKIVEVVAAVSSGDLGRALDADRAAEAKRKAGKLDRAPAEKREAGTHDEG